MTILNSEVKQLNLLEAMDVSTLTLVDIPPIIYVDKPGSGTLGDFVRDILPILPTEKINFAIIRWKNGTFAIKYLNSFL